MISKRRRYARRRLELHCLIILLFTWKVQTVRGAVSSSSVWASSGGSHDDDDDVEVSSSSSATTSAASTKSRGGGGGRPLHWLQQHWPHLFGPREQGGAKHAHDDHAKRGATGAGESGKDEDHFSGRRRRLLYHDALERHVLEAWTAPTTVSATAYHYFSRLSSSSASAVPGGSFPPFPPSMREATLSQIRDMFYHAYDGYYWNAWPHGELLPGSCEGANFSLIKLPALTAIDALDTFWILRNTTEMIRVVERLRQLQDAGGGRSLWDVNQNVSVFETTIRILGGLLSAHQMLVADGEQHQHQPSQTIWQHDIWDPVTGLVLDGRSIVPKHKIAGSCPAPPPILCAREWPPCLDGTAIPATFTSSCDATTNTTRRSTTTAAYQYDGYLLELAIDIADRMVPAFDTDTGIPYGTVHLQTGVPRGETAVASLAGAGTLILEWELLSRLTDRPMYGRVARRAARGLWMRQSDLHLVGKHIDTRNGHWVESLSGIGSNSDSFIEYLVKYCFVFLDGKGPDDDFRSLWPAIYQGVYKHMKRGDWYGDTDYQTPASKRSVLESLMAFYPGLQIWLGELSPAARSLNAFFLVREYLGFLPERFSYSHWRADGPRYPLRPELYESNYFMHRAVQKVPATSPFSSRSTHSGWLWAAMWSVQKLAQLQTSCGYASLHRVDPHSTGAIGEGSTDWKAENDMPSFFLSETLKYLYLTFDEENVLHNDDDRQWMFTTEAHPIHLPVVSSSEEEDNFTDDLYLLEEILLRRSQGKRTQNREGKAASDMWATETPFKDFLSKLWPVELEMKREQISRPRDAFFFHDRHLLQAIGETSSSVRHDDWEETEHFRNLAHVKFSDKGVGAGFALRAACPNYYASDLLWIHALNGESLDLTIDFRPKSEDHVREKSSRRPFGSVEALDFYGMSYNPSNPTQGTGCPLRSVATELAKKKTTRKDKESEEVAEFVSDVGTFQITAFKDSTGFNVLRKEDGHVITASFMVSADEHEEGVTYIMVLSENPHGTMQDTVNMADFSGNAYTCDVSLLRVPREEESELTGEEVVRVPCVSLSSSPIRRSVAVCLTILPSAQTPAMFGPAHMANLRATRGATVQATIHSPSLSDITGCQTSDRNQAPGSWIPKETLELLGEKGLSMCPNNNIQMVGRGICSFMTKAINQKLGREADAVIIINAQDELFTMAGDYEYDSLDPKESPLSVMVSRRDGKKLLTAMNDIPDEDYRVVGKVALEAQPAAGDLERIVSGGASVRLPLVYASESLIQIYAEGHWGVQAQVVDSNWNLQLVRHNLG